MPTLIYLLMAIAVPDGDSAVFPQRGTDGIPVRWEKDSVVLQVGRPDENSISMSQVRLLALTQEAVEIFNGPLGIELVVQNGASGKMHSQENGINEIAVKEYPPCAVKNGVDTSACNDENRFGFTRLYPATRVAQKQIRAIAEADIELNAAAFAAYPQDEQQKLLIAVLRHELGHLLGLAHNCVSSRWHQRQYRGATKPPVCDNRKTDHIGALMYPIFEDHFALTLAPNPSEWAYLQILYPAKNGESQSRFPWLWIGVGLAIAFMAAVAGYVVLRKQVGLTGRQR